MIYFWQDPYVNDPSRHPALKINTKKPFNAEPPMQLLADNFVTPNDIFFIRNHLPVPDINANTYELEITGEGVKTIKLSLEVGEVPLLKRGLSWGEPLDATYSKRIKKILGNFNVAQNYLKLRYGGAVKTWNLFWNIATKRVEK